MSCCKKVSKIDLARNLGAAAGRAAKTFVKTGTVRAPQEVQAARLAACRKCESYDALSVRCRQCGCFLSAKVTLVAEKCPLGLW